MTLKEILKRETGRNIDYIDNSSYIEEWLDWYKGKVKTFHSYSIYNGKKYVPFQRFTLAMAKRACEDWANLLINEKTDITLSDADSQKTLEKIFDKCHFWRKANDGIEKTFALGMGAFVVSVENLMADDTGVIVSKENASVKVSFINATKIKPVTFEDGDITECIFITKDTKRTIISAHLKDENGIYYIYNITADGTDESNLGEIKSFYVFNTGSAIPWFAIIRPNISNNIDINSPMGISIFANYIDILKEIDLIYDSYQNEFALGRKRIFINARNSTIDNDGNEYNVFDSNDVAFYVLPEADNDDGVFIKNDTQPLRISEHEQGLQNQLNLYAYACGFGTNHYKFNGGSVATATQIVSENSDLFRNLKKHEIIIEEALRTVVKAVIYATNNYTVDIIDPNTNFEIKFDDSIIEDKQGEKANDRIDVSMGVMSKAEYRSKWYNEDIKTAEKKIDEIDAFSIPETDYTPDDTTAE